MTTATYTIDFNRNCVHLHVILDDITYCTGYDFYKLFEQLISIIKTHEGRRMTAAFLVFPLGNGPSFNDTRSLPFVIKRKQSPTKGDGFKNTQQERRSVTQTISVLIA